MWCATRRATCWWFGSGGSADGRVALGDWRRPSHSPCARQRSSGERTSRSCCALGVCESGLKVRIAELHALGFPYRPRVHAARALRDRPCACLLERRSGPEQLAQGGLDAPENGWHRSRSLWSVRDPTDRCRRLDEVAAAVVELVVRCASRGRAGGAKRSWRARRCHAAFGVELRRSSSTMLAGASIVAATSSLVRAQDAAAVRSAAAVSWSEASNSACRSCDGPAPPRAFGPTGRSARVSPRDALVGVTGRDEGVRAGMAATAEGV